MINIPLQWKWSTQFSNVELFSLPSNNYFFWHGRLYFVTLFSNLILIFYDLFSETAWPNSNGVNDTFFVCSRVVTFSFPEIRSFWSASRRIESLGTRMVLPGHDCTISRSVRSTRIKNMGPHDRPCDRGTTGFLFSSILSATSRTQQSVFMWCHSLQNVSAKTIRRHIDVASWLEPDQRVRE